MEKAVEIQNLAKLFDSNQKLFPRVSLSITFMLIVFIFKIEMNCFTV